MSRRSRPLVIVGIPAWQGANFLGDTMRSVLGQRDVELRVIISIDGPDEPSIAACQSFLDDPRVEILTHAERVGWLKNAVQVMGAAVARGADYACIQPQDDLLEPNYLSSLLAVAEASPGTAVVYSDIRTFGELDQILSQMPVLGSPLARQAAVLINHFDAVAYRGLTRVSALAGLADVPGNPFDDFAADTVAMANAALFGDLRRIPIPLYRKRYHAANTHTAWLTWPAERKVAAWLRHCRDMLSVALKAAAEPAEKNLLVNAARARLLGTRGSNRPYRREINALGEEGRARLLREFDAGLPLG